MNDQPYEPISEESDAANIIDITLDAAAPNKIDPGDVYVVTAPQGREPHLLDTESLLDCPRRKRVDATFWDSESLCAYVKQHKEAGTGLFLNDQTAQIVGVINGDSDEVAGWGDHRAVLKFRKTDAWQRWLKLDDQFIEQEAFAEHIERNLIDIVEPAGADLLELAQTFQATTSAEFRSQKRLANGQRQFQYSENIDGKGGANGELEIPERFKLGIAPFEGVDPYPVDARLRFRLSGGHLKLGYVLDNPKDVERAAMTDVADDVSRSTELAVLFGEIGLRPTPRP